MILVIWLTKSCTTLVTHLEGEWCLWSDYSCHSTENQHICCWLCGGGDATIFNTLRNKIQLIYSTECIEADTFSSQHNQNCQCWTNRQLSQLCRFESAHMTHIVKSCAPQPRLHECMCDCVSYRCVHCSCIEGMCVFAFVRLWPLLFHQGNQIWNCSFFFSFEILEAERKVSTQPSSTLTDFDTDIDNTT